LFYADPDGAWHYPRCVKRLPHLPWGVRISTQSKWSGTVAISGGNVYSHKSSFGMELNTQTEEIKPCSTHLLGRTWENHSPLPQHNAKTPVEQDKMTARQRRRMQRQSLANELSTNGDGSKDTYKRNTIITPDLVGKSIEVHNV
jgi:hypothetical protein